MAKVKRKKINIKKLMFFNYILLGILGIYSFMGIYSLISVGLLDVLPFKYMIVIISFFIVSIGIGLIIMLLNRLTPKFVYKGILLAGIIMFGIGINYLAIMRSTLNGITSKGITK